MSVKDSMEQATNLLEIIRNENKEEQNKIKKLKRDIATGDYAHITDSENHRPYIK